MFIKIVVDYQRQVMLLVVVEGVVLIVVDFVKLLVVLVQCIVQLIGGVAKFFLYEKFGVVVFVFVLCDFVLLVIFQFKQEVCFFFVGNDVVYFFVIFFQVDFYFIIKGFSDVSSYLLVFLWFDVFCVWYL